MRVYRKRSPAGTSASLVSSSWYSKLPSSCSSPCSSTTTMTHYPFPCAKSPFQSPRNLTCHRRCRRQIPRATTPHHATHITIRGYVTRKCRWKTFIQVSRVSFCEQILDEYSRNVYSIQLHFDWLMDWSFVRLPVPSIDRLIDWLIGVRLIDRLIAWLIDRCSVDWLIDWVNVPCPVISNWE